MSTADDWLHRLKTLRVYRAKAGPAPHKPLLLLVIIYLIEQREFITGTILLSPELAFHFETFWSIVAHRRSQNGDVRLPFFHLRTDGVWNVFENTGVTAQRREMAAFAVMDERLFELLSDPVFRARAKKALIATYFQPAEQAALCELTGTPTTTADYVGVAVDSSVERPGIGREAKFRIDVVVAYDYTCALTGYRITTVGFGTLVDAAHIHAFSDSRNNDPKNGLALSKNAHWSFDVGLWSLSDDFRVLIAHDQFYESSPNAKPLAEFHGEKVRLPADQALWPDPSYLGWHRRQRFAGSVKH